MSKLSLDRILQSLEMQPVGGGLDHDITSMLLMSDDGAFIHPASSPKCYVPKVCQVTTDQPVTPKLMTVLLAGVHLHKEPCWNQCDARYRSQVGRLAVYSLGLKEDEWCCLPRTGWVCWATTN